MACENLARTMRLRATDTPRGSCRSTDLVLEQLEEAPAGDTRVREMQLLQPAGRQDLVLVDVVAHIPVALSQPRAGFRRNRERWLHRSAGFRAELGPNGQRQSRAAVGSEALAWSVRVIRGDQG